MPAAIPFIVGSIASVFVSAGAVAAWTLAASVAVGAYEAKESKRKGRRAAARAQAEYEASVQDRLLTVRSAVSTYRYVLGTARVGGTLMYAETLGENKEALDSVFALANNHSDLVSIFVDESQNQFEDPTPGFAPTYISRFEQTDIDPHSPATRVFNVADPPFDPDGDGFLTSAHGWADVEAWCVTNIDGSDRDFLHLTITAVDPSARTVTVGGIPNVGGKTRITIRYETHALGAGSETSKAVELQYRNGLSTHGPTEWGNYPSPSWTSAHLLQGIPHFRVLLVYDETFFKAGTPTIGAVLRGNGAETHRIYDPRVSADIPTSDNPALLALWFMTLPLADGGMGIPRAWVDLQSVITAANICDELITVRTHDGAGFEQIKRYQCNTVVDTEASPIDNIEIICSSMAEGRPVFTGAGYRVFAGAFRSATITITDSDIDGTKPMTFANTSTGDSPPNVCKATFADARHGWNETSSPAVINQSYITLDGRETPIEIQLPATTDARQANYIQGVRLERMRPSLTVSFTCKGIGEDIALKDTIQFNLSNRSFLSGKTYEVTTYIDHCDGTFSITAAQIRTQMWALDPNTFTPSNPEPLPDLGYLFNVPVLTNFAATVVNEPQTLPDGTTLTTVELTWDAITAPYIRDVGMIELRYADPLGNIISAGSVPANSTSTRISAPLEDQMGYVFQARAINGIGAAGRWAFASVTIDGTELAVGVQGSGLFTWTGLVGVETTPTSIRKTGAGAAFDAGAYSMQSYQGGSFMAARAGAANISAIVGLTSDPAIDSGATNIDYAWRFNPSGIVEIRENNTFVTGMAYDANTVVSITYDNESVNYLRDGVIARTVPNINGARFFLDVSLASAGAEITDIAFGPMGGRGTQGLPGSPAQTVRLNSNAQAFVFTAAGVASPTSIQFDAVRNNIPVATNWSTTPSVPLTGSGDTRTLTSANFGANTQVKVRAEASGFFDEITIVRLTQGSNAVQAYLTNESHAVAANPDGIATDFSLANGRTFVFEGATDVTASAALGVVGTVTGATFELNTATNTPIASQPKGYYRVTAMSVDQIAITIRATYNGVNYDKVFTVTKSKQGQPGDDNNLFRNRNLVPGALPTNYAGDNRPMFNGFAGFGAPDPTVVLGGSAPGIPNGPFNTSEPLIRLPNGTGFHTGIQVDAIPIDTRKTHRSAVWFYSSTDDAGSEFHHGCELAHQLVTDGGASVISPFFTPQAGVPVQDVPRGLERGRWYLSIGIVHAKGYTGGYSGFGGIYDPRDGKKLYDGREYRSASTHPDSWFARFYAINADTTTSIRFLARPRLEELNGNEPSILDLLGRAPTTPWIAQGYAYAGDSTFIKNGGGDTWENASVSSVAGYRTCHLQFKAARTTAYFMVGLTTDPMLNLSYASIDYAWYCVAGGILQIYENGAYIGDFGSYTAETELAMVRDETTGQIIYYKDRVAMRTVSSTTNSQYFVDSSFYSASAEARQVRFGPGIALENVSTSDMAPASVTDSVFSGAVSGSFPYGTISSGSSFLDIREVVFALFTNTYSQSIRAEIEYGGLFGIAAAELNGISRWVRLDVLNPSSPGAGYQEPVANIYLVSNAVNPDRRPRNGAVSVIVPPGGTIRARLEIVLVAFAGTYPSVPNFLYDNATIRITGYRR